MNILDTGFLHMKSEWIFIRWGARISILHLWKYTRVFWGSSVLLSRKTIFITANDIFYFPFLLFLGGAHTFHDYSSFQKIELIH